MNYFTSDVHFGTDYSIENDLRPFKNAKQLDKSILKIWNKTMKKGDNLYVIGDFVDCDGEGFDSWKKSLPYVKKVKANVFLILGNNEGRVVKYYFNNDFQSFKEYCLSLGFKDVCKSMFLEVAGQKMYLVHKPIDYKKGYLNLFGHMHAAGGIYKPFGLNVGCDINHFRPYSEKDIVHLLKKKKIYWDKDKNLNMKID